MPKSKRIFELCFILNFTLSLSFIILANIINLKRNYEDFYTVLIFLAIIFIVIIAPFNLICFVLLKAYKYNLQLSKKVKVLGLISNIIFFLFSVFLAWGSIDLLSKFSTDIYLTNWMAFIAYFLFWVTTITSICLSISYWVIRHQVKYQYVDVISEIGK
jgi:hypothetical protein